MIEFTKENLSKAQDKLTPLPIVLNMMINEYSKPLDLDPVEEIQNLLSLIKDNLEEGISIISEMI